EATPRLEEVSPEEVILRLENATLDARAPRQLVPPVGAAVRSVRISEVGAAPPSVEIRVQRPAGLRTELSRRGAIIALEIARPYVPPAEASVRMKLVDRPLVELVREVQRITQQTFVWDDRLQGTATVIIQDAVTPGEALEILQSTLFAKGFSAVPSPGGALLVLPLDEARARAPKIQRALDRERAGLITVLVRFRNANVEQLVNLLAPFAGGAMTVVAYAPTNGAILVGAENAIHRWLELARSLDETSGRELVVIRPLHRTAAELYELLAEAVRDPYTGRARVELFLDERSNALIARAEPPALAGLRAQIAELDAPPPLDGHVLVLRPRFADPEALAKQIEALAAGRGAEGAPGALGGALQGARFQITRDVPTRSLLISGDAATQREIRELVTALDREPPLIALEAQVLEIATRGALSLGFDAFLPSTDPSDPGRSIFGVGIGDPFDQAPDPIIPTGPTFVARSARNPVVIPIIGPGGIPVNVALPREIVQMKLAEGEVRLRTLMQPRFVTLSGQEDEFSAGLNVPIPIAQAASAQAGAEGDVLSTRVNVERQDVGLRLRVKPVVGVSGDVRIAVDLEVTNLLPADPNARSGIGPEVLSRKLQAHTRVDDGGAAVLGMVLERASTSGEFGAPGLMEVPVLGHLLRQTLDATDERTLVLTLQARILRGSDERLADTIRLRTAHERALARSRELVADGGAWVLRVATRTTRADADALAASLGEVAGRRAHVVAWRWAEAERFDVVLSGFAGVREAADALPELDAHGWSGELIAVPRGDAAGN
ncbi:MAG: secretin N-terminal domain-containing protein, partial [Myxococcota bacterium]